ncbi:MAG: hypothetical protein SGBAC_005722 [Bacillariaceae sp.]
MFRIAPSPIHGVGLFASRDIPADTPILDEQVCIRMPVDLTRDSGDSNLLAEYVSKLSPDLQTSFLALDGEDLLDKLWMNGSPLMDFEKDPLGIGPRKDLGIYLLCARLNHSCIPNAVRASDKGNVMSVVSQKDIAAGEEITISYMDDNLTTSVARERQMRHKIRVGKMWESCCCPLCSGPKEVKDISDGRRLRLGAYRERLLAGRLSKKEVCTEFLPLMYEEGLPVSLMGHNACLKMMALMTGIDMSEASRDTIHSYSFSKGSRVVLHKLKAKPELNGKQGRVVLPLNKKTGRVGVLLDDDSLTISSNSHAPVALKPENLCLVRQS